jgi:2-iminobutanoate/2-iminopropanoate deaminase
MSPACSAAGRSEGPAKKAAQGGLRLRRARNRAHDRIFGAATHREDKLHQTTYLHRFLKKEESMKKIVSTNQAPKAIGPYSQAVRYGDWLLVSGQIALDPATNELVAGDVAVQARRVLDNLMAIVEAAGMTSGDVLKCSCFLKDMNDFARFNEVYETYFQSDPPAREAVEVARLPKDVLIEISAICGK